MIKLNTHRFLLVVCAMILVSQSGCHSISHSAHSVSCDSLPDADRFYDDAIFDDGQCDSFPCDCDGGCDACCVDPSRDACDASPGFGSHQLVRGQRNRFLDGCGSILGTVSKLALWDKRADCHHISPQTERQVLAYLRRNRLNSVLVRSNQYDPIGEWGRLVANKRMAAPWKYTFGTYDWLKYTLIPGRLLGGDWYNPFTDTVHLYSDIPTIGLAKAAYAKDVHSRTLPGTYAAAQDTPIIGLWHESLANAEVFRYLGRNGSQADVSEARRILIPDFGGALGAQAVSYTHLTLPTTPY